MDLTDLPLPSRSNAPVETQDGAASTSATPFAKPPTIAAPKSSAQRQREYRQRIAASRTPAESIATRKSNTERIRNYRLRKAAKLALANGLLKSVRKSSAQRQREYRERIAASRTPEQLIATRISDAERKRNYRLRKAAKLALASGSLESTTASSSRSAGKSNDVQNGTQRQLTDQQHQSLAAVPAQTTVQPAAACKQRWQCHKDAYGLAAKNMKLWQYENEMVYVAPYLMERKPQYSVETTSEGELSENADESYTTEFKYEDTSEIPNTAIEVEWTPDITNIMGDAKSTKIKEEFEIDPPEPSASAILVANLHDQNQIEPPRRHDELDRFFLIISDTVKKFPSYVQALAKNKIFSLVSEMELQQLAPTTTQPTPTPYAFKTSPQSTSPDHENDQTQFFS